MAGYAIAGVPFTDFYGQQSPDYSTVGYVSYDIEWGTSSAPNTIYEGNGGYVKGYKLGSNYNAPYMRMNGSTMTGKGLRSIIGVTNDTKLYLYAYSGPSVHQVIVRYSFNNSDSDFINKVVSGNWSSDDILYINSYENAEAQGALEIARDWDETPTEDADDPNNLNPSGGAFADVGAFDETFLQDVLPDPEDMENVNTGGLVCCYSLDASDMNTLNDCLFEADFWQNLANRFSGLSDPLSMILQCVELPLIPERGFVAVAKIGGISIMTPPEGGSSHSISLPSPKKRYGRYYIGNLINKEVWGSEKDYSATSVSIYLPYVGVKELDVDVVMDNTLELYLYVDYWTGDILYLLRVSNSIRPAKYYTQTSVIYRWTGNCAREVPLGRIDNTGPILHAASAIGSAFAGFVGGASVGTVAASSGLDIEAGTTQIQTGSPNVPKNLNGFINGFTPTIQTSGNIAGNVGSMDYQYPYLIIKRGVPEYPNGWRGEIGAPRNQMLTISSLSGYTLFSTVYLENIECMAEEKAELERLLTTEGVIL